MKNKAYIGDGVYADFDGFNIVLTTENGVEVTNTIFLEPEVFMSLLKYAERLSDYLESACEVKGES